LQDFSYFYEASLSFIPILFPLFGALPAKMENIDDSDGTPHFMVNVIEPQFNLHSEDANVSLQNVDT
jgi:hypothetical protein